MTKYSPWGAVVDTQAWFDLPGTTNEPTGWLDDNPQADPFESHNTWLDAPVAVEGSYSASPQSIVILEQQL